MQHLPINLKQLKIIYNFQIFFSQNKAMNCQFKHLISFLLILSVVLAAQTTILLDIPPRLQWPNNNGYCGQTAVQSIYLYYGSYISQLQVRNIAGSEFLIGVNGIQTLEKLSLLYESWDNSGPAPQYQSYLQWIKTKIQAGYAVIISGYVANGTNSQYDHIYLAVGVQSADFSVYSDDDVLIYADFFDPSLIYTPFGKVWDTRNMTGNGMNLSFAIPRDIDYGIAVKGYDSHNGTLFPLKTTLGQNDQPNVSAGQNATTFTLTITASNLQSGTAYTILRFNTNTPLVSNYASTASANAITRFTTNSTTYTFSDTVSSNSMAFYRCVTQSNLTSALNDDFLHVYVLLLLIVLIIQL